MPAYPTPRERGLGKGLRLLSLDPGGSQSLSQLGLLANILHRLAPDIESHSMDRPCAAFDIICGVGTGGFITILLVVFGLTAEEALTSFLELNANVLDAEGMGPEERTVALKEYIEDLMEKYQVKRDARLMDPNDLSRGCKLAIPIAYKTNLGAVCTLRNFPVDHEKVPNVTIAEALLITLATPPLFDAITISKQAGTSEYISGDFVVANPIRKIIGQAYEAFGPEEEVACLLSIGCGHPGVLTIPSGSNLTTWNHFLKSVISDSEKEAQTASEQLGHLGIYHRLSVIRGLEKSSIPKSSDILTHTGVYLEDVHVSRQVNLCTELLKKREGVVTLKQLRYSGGSKIFPPSGPALTNAFVMRQKPWEFIEAVMLGTSIHEEPTRQKLLVVTGMGGCGKTQIIRKFVQTHGNSFASIFFIDASSESRMRASILQNVRSLGIEYSQMSFEDCMAFLAHPVTRHSILIVYDNLDDPELDIFPFLPEGDNCAIIITSRNHLIGELSLDAHLELDVMSVEEAIEMLLHVSSRSSLPIDQIRKEAAAVAKELGYLPIALAQARSYMYHTKCSGDAYLKKFLRSRDKLLAKPVKHQRDMRYTSTHAAFDASFEMLDDTDKKLVQLLSFFHWAKFPLELITIAAKHDFSSYERQYTDPGEDFRIGKQLLQDIFYPEGRMDHLHLDKMIISIQNYSLASVVTYIGGTLVQMHPLMHKWVHSCIEEQEKPKYLSAAVLMLALGARRDHTPSDLYLTSHVTHLSPTWDALHINEAESFARILHRAGLFADALKLRERVVAMLRNPVGSQNPLLPKALGSLASTYYGLGRFFEAEVIQTEGLELLKDTLGGLHPDTFIFSNDLSDIYTQLGRYAEAERLQVQGLRLLREISGPLDPDTISAACNMACIHAELGKNAELETLRVEVLKLRKETLGERYPDALAVMYNLSLTYCRTERFAEAEALALIVLEQMKEMLGERHPWTISASHNLAVVYYSQGRHSEAHPLQEEALRLQREMLGADHPTVARTLSGRVFVSIGLWKFEEAEPLAIEVLRIRRKVLGEHHPDTLHAAFCLALIWLNLGRLLEAEPLLVEVVRFRKKLVGERYQGCSEALELLSIIYLTLSRFEEAEPLQKELLRIKEQTSGHRHASTIDTSNLLALTYSMLGRFGDAEVLQLDVLEARRETNHPDLVVAIENLARSYFMMRSWGNVEPLQTEALGIRTEMLGDSHPDTLAAATTLAATYTMLGKLGEAEQLQVRVLGMRHATLGERHPDTIFATSQLALTYQQQDRPDAALERFWEVLAMREETLGEDHPDTIRAMHSVVETLSVLGQASQALDLLERMEAILADTVGPNHPQYERCLQMITRCLE